MPGWFSPRCPVDPAAKSWIEDRLKWLSGQFGLDTFTRRAVILPTNDFFPDPVEETEASVGNLLDQVCRYMDVDPRLVCLRLFTNRNDLWVVNDEGRPMPTGAAGLYEARFGKTLIHIEQTEILQIADLVATMAHELSHLRLMGQHRVMGNEYDNELLTDLTAVFHGFGIFLGNSPRDWHGEYGKWPGTNLRRPEYMSLPMFGYALAHSAWFRAEKKPVWFPFLSRDLRTYVKQGLRYLRETGDSNFAPDNAS